MNIWNNKNWTPMLLSEQKEIFNSKDFIYEVKYDGIRALIFVTPKKIIIQSRKKQDITHLYPELSSIKKLVKKPTIFDGEIICFENKMPSFSKLQERNHLKSTFKIKYQSKINPSLFVCFDILYDNKSLLNMNLMERKKILNRYNNSKNFYKVLYVENDGISLFKKIKKVGLEGIVAKKNQVFMK